jgi:ribonuclease HI
MELTGLLIALKGIQKTKYPVSPFNEIEVYSDSAYLVNAFNQNWIKSWLNNCWVNSKKEPVANQDLWREILKLLPNNITFNKVKGHSGNEYNEIADKMAVYAKTNKDSNIEVLNNKEINLEPDTYTIGKFYGIEVYNV